MKSSVKEHLKQSAFHYLDENLDASIKKDISTSALMQVLDCLSEWMYEDRQSVMQEFVRGVIQKAQNKLPTKDGESSEFMKELQKI